MRRSIWICALAVLALPACQSGSSPSRSPLPSGGRADDVAARLDQGSWMVNQHTQLWKVMAASAPNRPPRHIGFVEERHYRQKRGGPVFRMYSVTRLDRSEQIGHVDQLGRAFRYEPRRNGTFDKVAIGSNTLELNVQAIFDTLDDVTLRETNERRIAFESLDANGDGVLQPDEARAFGDRISGADSNKDGVVDFEEFDAADVL